MLKFGKWQHLYSNGPFKSRGGFAGISGGRTSAMMAALLDPSVKLLFQNTGREHPGTYDFLNELDRALGNRIVWLEWRPPKKKGDRPMNFQFAVVDYKTADRSGGPFEGFMQALANYRASKGESPITPWAKQRICTAYMKRKVMEAYVRSLDIDIYESFIGLRADEPERVHRIKNAETRDKTFRCPLYDAGITKNDVLLFWKQQSFDLGIRENQGNCTGCFLKDQGDLSRVMGEPESDAQWWIALERKYSMFGGRDFVGYENLLRERPLRLKAETLLKSGQSRQDTIGEFLQEAAALKVDPKRLKLVVYQEDRRRVGETQSFSCSCEASYLIDDDKEAA